MLQAKAEMSRVGVYKTDVDDRLAAKMITNAIRQHLPGCDASFDLEDCDNVLRVEHFNGDISESKIRQILHHYGYQIEALP